ncbi:YsnF/AvaK domain-containing protein [Cytophagaceae bacterium ABcell3]|nr:YsnF/AvaK domain-containing protein [Cytophagaceae bacterium ABcell3]
MAKTVVGLFNYSDKAHIAAQELIEAGIPINNIDIAGEEHPENIAKSEKKEEDSFSKFFNNLFGDTEESRTYSHAARTGGTLVTVHCKSTQEAETAARILDENGAVDIDEKLKKDKGYQEKTGSKRTTDKSETIPVIEEEMNVGKKKVDTGGVKLRSRIIDKPVEEKLRLRTEKINVERNPVNRKATEAELENFKEGSIEAREKKEVPVVNKEARVVEEVHLKKDVKEKEETIRDRVKRQDVEVEKGKEQQKKRVTNPDNPNIKPDHN